MADNYNGDHGTIYNTSEYYDASVYKQDGFWDIAILTPERNILTARSAMILTTPSGESLGPKKRTLPRFQTFPPREGDAVSVSGFPAVLGLDTGIPGITTNGGKIANAVFDSGGRRFVYLTDMHINHGDSGGPVFENESGLIIGFMDAYTTATNGENSGLAIVIPIKHVLSLLPPE